MNGGGGGGEGGTGVMGCVLNPLLPLQKEGTKISE